MSKTYEMWVDENSVKKIEIDDHGSFNRRKTDHFKYKVTMTIHEERKVTITEDDFNSIFENWRDVRIFKEAKEKLFNKQD